MSAIVLTGSAAAQDAASSSKQGRDAAQGAVVTASSTASGVRFVSPGQSRRVRLEVYTKAGERLFDSDFRAGNIVDWDAQGIADGSYLCVVTTEDLQGAGSRRLSAVNVSQGRASVRGDNEEKLRAEFAQALAASGQYQSDALAARQKKAQALTLTAHDGQDGQVTSTTGSLTFRTGDVLSGNDKEQMRVTPEGRVGVGTNDPQATLDVAGTVRAQGGIVFGDGTVLKSANDLKGTSIVGVTPNAAGGAPTLNATGTGTAGKLTKWTGTDTVGDSVITESSGNVGIGIASPNPNGMLHVHKSQATGTSLFVTNDNAGTTALSSLRAGLNPSDYATDYTSLNVLGAGWTPGAGGSFFKGKTGLLESAGSNFGIGNINNTEPIIFYTTAQRLERMRLTAAGNFGIGTVSPTQKLEVAGNIKVSGAGNGIMFADGSVQTTAGGGGSMTGTSIVSAINDAATSGFVGEARLSPNVAKLNAQNNWTGQNTFNGLSMNGTNIVNVANPVSATDAVNKAYVDANTVKFVPGAEQLSVGDANGTAPMINLRGGSTCCSGPGGHTPAWFKVFQNGSFVATGNLGIGVSPMQGKGYRTSWDSYKGAFRSGYADAEWDDANVGFFSWAGGSNSTAIGLYALAFGDTNSAESTSSIVFGSGNQVKGAAGFSAGAGNRVCDTYGVAFGNKAQSGGPLINGKCDPDSFNLRGLAAVAIGYNVTADQDHTTAMGKFASNNGFSGTFIWSDGSATASADTFRNTSNNEFAARATGGFRFRTNLTGTTGCNLPAGSGVFNCTSTRTTKENFFDVNGDDVLAKLRKVPVSTWNYIAEGQQSRHLGPMAEDFYGAFKLGTSDKSIGIQDAVGVSLAAVKALDARTLELQQKTEEVEQLRTKVNSLEQRLAALEQLMQKQTVGQDKK
ncbi:MAG TPA: tail fiber domain-containing protein [Pyrinomonadaceae bacterium]|nr:tail fiber domain-containing protein [Pyrinomonadaceae bacterium]